MRSELIRSTFLEFFGDRGHLLVPEGPLLPDDETLLFAVAGMVQFKPYFLGTQRPPGPRLMSAQRCVRTVDIDTIGQTTRHATSFEMLGNFSFGDYFKQQSMVWALELFDRFGIERERLWVTVFESDDETHGLWRGLGMPEERIQRLGAKDNFWTMGVPGLGGPSTEMFYDRGERHGEAGGPAVNGERYLELWNLVFIPERNVDGGMGLDRMALVLQDAHHLQEIDVTLPLLRKVRELTGRDDAARSHRLITDHLRTSMLLIGEGVRPGTTGRGYVVRRLLRRAIHHLYRLGVPGPALGALTGSDVVAQEEVRFGRTLRAGERLLQRELGRRGRIDGGTAFTLHDTYGFPVELTEEIARESGVDVDLAGFAHQMQEHRRRSRLTKAAPESPSS
jgi:alanyl-tRNA synthetase